MKRGLIAFSLFLVASVSFAGDVAAFKDIGFSNDGRFYIFAQYGKTDINYQPYAEIYTVDVTKNEYIRGGVYKTILNNSILSGSQVYEDLFAKHSSEIQKYGCKTASINDVLYILENEKKDGAEEIVFQNYGDATLKEQFTYTVRLVPSFSGFGTNTVSSFYIDLDMKDASGKSRGHYKVGSPSVRRKGVVDYKVIRIFRDRSKSALIFVVEKTIEDESGTSIRYMVETVKL